MILKGGWCGEISKYLKFAVMNTLINIEKTDRGYYEEMSIKQRRIQQILRYKWRCNKHGTTVYVLSSEKDKVRIKSRVKGRGELESAERREDMQCNIVVL